MKNNIQNVKTKIVDVNGNPLVVYHGTNNKFNEFSNNYKGSNTNWDNTKFGFFFLSDKEQAEKFIKDHGNGGETYIISAYLDIKNPIDVRTKSIFSCEEQATAIVKLISGLDLPPKKALKSINKQIDLSEWSEFWEELMSDRAQNFYKEWGFDGMISDFGGGVVEYVAFEPHQIEIIKA